MDEFFVKIVRLITTIVL